jgi:hypothetical protein
MKSVIVVIGSGLIGQAIARRVGVGKHVLLADLRLDNANAAAEVLGNAGYDVSVATVNAASRGAVHALAETATGLATSPGLSMLPASPRQRHHRRRSSKSICMARHSSWRNSAMSSPAGVLVSSSRRSPGIVFLRSLANRIKRWPQHPWRSCSVFPSFSQIR